MLETERLSVQRLTIKRRSAPGRRVEPVRLGLEAGAIDRIAEQRMADMGEMDPDLVRAPGLQPARDQRRRPSGSSTRQCVTAMRPRARDHAIRSR